MKKIKIYTEVIVIFFRWDLWTFKWGLNSIIVYNIQIIIVKNNFEELLGIKYGIFQAFSKHLIFKKRGTFLWAVSKGVAKV